MSYFKSLHQRVILKVYIHNVFMDFKKLFLNFIRFYLDQKEFLKSNHYKYIYLHFDGGGDCYINSNVYCSDVMLNL